MAEACNPHLGGSLSIVVEASPKSTHRDSFVPDPSPPKDCLGFVFDGGSLEEGIASQHSAYIDRANDGDFRSYCSTTWTPRALAGPYSGVRIERTGFGWAKPGPRTWVPTGSLLSLNCYGTVSQAGAMLFQDARALLLIAHPDDESMFFIPILKHILRQPAAILHVLCLSTGALSSEAALENSG